MPELFQIIGAVLRDIAQARYMSDRYSRQISYRYEEDSVLRRFPVPRVEIEEAEFDLHFSVQAVEVDSKRKTSENTAISSLFDAYSASITREGLGAIREAVQRRVAAKETSEAEKKAAADLERTFLSEDNREKLRGRLLRYLNENASTLIDTGAGALKTELVEQQVIDFVSSLAREREMVSVMQTVLLGDEGWKAAFEEGKKRARNELESMAADIQAVRGRYPDFRIEVEVSPDALRNHPAVSRVRVKSVVKNYHWAKVDVDTEEMRNIRTLNPE